MKKKPEELLYWAGFVGMFAWGVQMYRKKKQLEVLIVSGKDINFPNSSNI